MMNHKRALRDTQLLVSQGLPPSRHRRLRNHLRGCDDCLRHYERLRAVEDAITPGAVISDAALERMGELVLDETATPAARGPGWAWASGLLASTALAVALVVVVRPASDDGELTARGGTVATLDHGFSAFIVDPARGETTRATPTTDGHVTVPQGKVVQLAYRNGSHRYAVVVGLDAGRETQWYHPDESERAAGGVALVSGATDEPFRGAWSIDRHGTPAFVRVVQRYAHRLRARRPGARKRALERTKPARHRTSAAAPLRTGQHVIDGRGARTRQMKRSRAIRCFCAALALPALGCGLDLARRDGELSVVFLDNEPFRGAEAIINIAHDDVTSESRHPVANEIILESVPAGTCRVSAHVRGHGLVSNQLQVYVYETTRVSIGLTFFPESAGADDDDGDGVDNVDDNCVAVANPEQSDEDHDGVGDRCDNCPAYPHPLQTNSDGDLFGDLCDPDIDGDGVLNVQDACPRDPGGSVDSDGDRVCDATDTCPLRDNPTQDDCDTDGVGDACDPDIDGDGIANDGTDNCPFAWNPAQDDGNGDRIGDACATDPNSCIPEAP